MQYFVPVCHTRLKILSFWKALKHFNFNAIGSKRMAMVRVEQTGKIRVGCWVCKLKSGPIPGQVHPTLIGKIPHHWQPSDRSSSNFQNSFTTKTLRPYRNWHSEHQDIGTQSGQVSWVRFCTPFTWPVRLCCSFCLPTMPNKTSCVNRFKAIAILKSFHGPTW